FGSTLSRPRSPERFLYSSFGFDGTTLSGVWRPLTAGPPLPSPEPGSPGFWSGFGVSLGFPPLLSFATPFGSLPASPSFEPIGSLDFIGSFGASLATIGFLFSPLPPGDLEPGPFSSFGVPLGSPFATSSPPG